MPVLYTRRTFQSLLVGSTFAGSILAAPSEVYTGPLADWRRHSALKKYASAFEFLEKTDFSKKEPGRFPIDGDRVYAMLTANKARLAEKAKFEAHRKYTDIHFLLDGAETIGSADPSKLKVIEPYKESGDIALYAVPASYRRIEMKPRSFAVFMPGQAHMPGCGTDTSAVIRKVVVKVLG